VASAIERLDPIDIETILGTNPAATREMIAEARERYLRAAGNPGPGAEDGKLQGPGGEIAARVRSVASRAISPGRGAP
jgi:hypothetical protein